MHATWYVLDGQDRCCSYSSSSPRWYANIHLIKSGCLFIWWPLEPFSFTFCRIDRGTYLIISRHWISRVISCFSRICSKSNCSKVLEISLIFVWKYLRKLLWGFPAFSCLSLWCMVAKILGVILPEALHKSAITLVVSALFNLSYMFFPLKIRWADRH